MRSYPYAGTTLSYPLPNQGITELCGPAAIAYDLMLTDPVAYISAMLSLYETGMCVVGDLYLQASKGLRGSSREGISAIDWMFLGAMREGRNMLFGVDSKAGPLALFSPPKDMLYWLRSIYPHERFVQRLSFVGWGSERAHRRAIIEALRKPTRSFLLMLEADQGGLQRQPHRSPSLDRHQARDSGMVRRRGARIVHLLYLGSRAGRALPCEGPHQVSIRQIVRE